MQLLYMSIFGVSLYQIVLSAFIILFALLFNRWLLPKIETLVCKILDRGGKGFLRKALTSFEGPIRFFVFITAVYIVLGLLVREEVMTQFSIFRWYRIMVILCLAKGIYNLMDTSSAIFQKFGQHYNLKTSAVIKSFVSKIARVIVVVMAISMVAKEFHYDLGALVAGLGIAGLAVSMAAKDTLANLIAGIVIVFDKPFDIGDWISNTEVEGVVEEINFRNTRIRAFEKEIITVPNLNLVSNALRNHSERRMRRVKFNMGFVYQTTKAELAQFVFSVREYLMQHEQISEEGINVTFDHFAESSLDVMILFFIETNEFLTYMKVKEEVNFKLMEIIEAQHLSVAFPSRSIYFENEFVSKEVNP